MKLIAVLLSHDNYNLERRILDKILYEIDSSVITR
jgi:hypothetical protein